MDASSCGRKDLPGEPCPCNAADREQTCGRFDQIIEIQLCEVAHKYAQALDNVCV